MALGSVLVTCHVAWYWDHHMSEFKRDVVSPQDGARAVLCDAGAHPTHRPLYYSWYGAVFGCSPLDLLDAATLLVTAFHNCLQSWFLSRLDVRAAAVTSVIQWAILACWPLVSPGLYPAWVLRIVVPGVWTAHLIHCSRLFDSVLKRQQATARELEDRDHADGMLTHMLKNTMADALGCIDRVTSSLGADRAGPLCKASDILFRGMSWCKLHIAMISIVAGRYESVCTTVDVQKFTEDLLRGREVVPGQALLWVGDGMGWGALGPSTYEAHPLVRSRDPDTVSHSYTTTIFSSLTRTPAWWWLSRTWAHRFALAGVGRCKTWLWQALAPRGVLLLQQVGLHARDGPAVVAIRRFRRRIPAPGPGITATPLRCTALQEPAVLHLQLVDHTTQPHLFAYVPVGTGHARQGLVSLGGVAGSDARKPGVPLLHQLCNDISAEALLPGDVQVLVHNDDVAGPQCGSLEVVHLNGWRGSLKADFFFGSGERPKQVQERAGWAMAETGPVGHGQWHTRYSPVVDLSACKNRGIVFWNGRASKTSVRSGHIGGHGGGGGW